MNADHSPGHRLLETEYPEKSKAIRQSMRCLAVGALACVPPFTLLLAWPGVELFVRVCRLTHERWRWLGLTSLQIAAGFGIGTLARFRYWPQAGTLLLAAAVVQSIWIWLHYRRTTPRRWNPARAAAYTGFALSLIGGLYVAALAGGVLINGIVAIVTSIGGL